MSNQALADKAEELRRLHAGPEILVLPNVWDVISARIVEDAGFKAIATSSAAVANSLGYPDGETVSRTEMLAVVKRIAAKAKVPVTADLEAGYGDAPGDMAETARAMIEAGTVGLNLEDGKEESGLVDLALHVAKIRDIREVCDSRGVRVVINARTDVYLAQIGEPESRFHHAVRRLNAYRQAGADSLFVPGVYDSETIGRLVKAVEGPLNVLAGPTTPSIPELQRLGVRRVSFGSWPARSALGLFSRFAQELAATGSFNTLGEWAIPYARLNDLLR